MYNTHKYKLIKLVVTLLIFAHRYADVIVATATWLKLYMSMKWNFLFLL
ncbi:MAG TPA: hypothetical protein PKL31_00340 [Fulvivirga sp.]|nr:hypothetical protein [Fulvivirga sp.]